MKWLRGEAEANRRFLTLFGTGSAISYLWIEIATLSRLGGIARNDDVKALNTFVLILNLKKEPVGDVNKR